MPFANVLKQWLSVSEYDRVNEQNQGLGSTSVPATQFLQERGITPRGAVREASAGETRANERTASVATVTEPSPYQSSRSLLDKRREELEHGAGGDHDLPYRFTLPTSMPQVLAWVKLLARVQQVQDFLAYPKSSKVQEPIP